MKLTDSPRWCAICRAWGEHHTDRHPNDDLMLRIRGEITAAEYVERLQAKVDLRNAEAGDR